MKSTSRNISRIALASLLLTILSAAAAHAQSSDATQPPTSQTSNCPTGWTGEICASPASWTFANTYLGKDSGNKTFTIYNNFTTSGSITIETVSFNCTVGLPTDWGIASGTVPFQMGTFQTLTHYSIFFQPSSAVLDTCNFVLTMEDGYVLDVPITGQGESGGAIASLSTTSMTFPNQGVGTTSAPQTVTVTNTGTSTMHIEAINISPPTFTTSPALVFPYELTKGSSVTLDVYYTPGEVTSETGVIDFDYDAVPDNGVTLNGNSIADTALTISTQPTLDQGTQGYAYEQQLATSGGVGPFTWVVASGSTLPPGLSLSSTGDLTGTISSSASTTTPYTFTIQVTDTSSGLTASNLFTLSVWPYLGDGNGESCNNLSWNDPILGTPMLALTDLGTGYYQGNTTYGEGGLYPNGSNSRPAATEAAGLAFAQGIQPLDSNGNPSPTGKYVLMAIGESTAQNEFNRFLPMANADPAKNPNLVLVNGAQGGATPNNFTSTTSAYWTTVLENYLPQNGVTQNQVVAIWMEDTDGIATGSFPTDITTLQSEYETMMNTMLTLFPNLKLVYFSSRVYAGYSNGLATPDNPEPYAYEVGFAVKWAIGDQINGNSNLNYNPANGPVVAPWMAWGSYYWANGMLGRSDGTEWDCEDFSDDGTHPSTTFGQLKVATKLFEFLKTDPTTIPWYLVPSYGLTPTAGNNQTAGPGTTLPIPLTVLANNTNSGVGISGVSVTFTDNGAGGTFNPPTAVTGSNGQASTSYTLPATAQTITATGSAPGYTSGTFTETASSQILAATGGNNQSGLVGTKLPTALTVTATNGGVNASGVVVSFTDNGAGGTFAPKSATTNSSGKALTKYTLPGTPQTITITASATGYSSATFTETATTTEELAVSSGNNQTGGTGTTLPAALTVLATNNGSPVSGVTVTFSQGSANGTFNPPTAVTNSSGLASTSYTLPSTAQTVTVTAAATGYTSATFTEIAALQTLAATSGNNQTGTGGVALPLPLVVTATSNGTAVSGVSVSFSDGGKGGSFGTPTGSTGSNGTISTTYTPAAGVTGTVTITASATNYSSATFTETVTLPALTPTAGNNQSGSDGTVLPVALTVTASNGASGVTVTFSDNGANGIFGTPTGVTGSGGSLSTTYTPTQAGTITITATASGYTSATFTETITQVVTSITVVSGNKQTGTVGTTLPLPIVLKAKNSAGKAVAGVAITYSDGGVGGTFSPNPAITGSNGETSVTFTLPTVAKLIVVNGANGSVFVNTDETSVAGPPAEFKVVSGNNQSANPDTKLAKPLIVSVADSYGNPISGVTVNFTDNGAGGTFGTPNPVTGTTGDAQTTYTTGSKAGTVTISATTSTLGPANFTETVK